MGGTPQNFGYTTTNQLASSGSIAFAYDAAGNPTTVASTTQTFDAAGQLCWSAPATSNPSCSTAPVHRCAFQPASSADALRALDLTVPQCMALGFLMGGA